MSGFIRKSRIAVVRLRDRPSAVARATDRRSSIRPQARDQLTLPGRTCIRAPHAQPAVFPFEKAVTLMQDGHAREIRMRIELVSSARLGLTQPLAGGRQGPLLSTRLRACRSSELTCGRADPPGSAQRVGHKGSD
jgi:hypothetical protein